MIHLFILAKNDRFFRTVEKFFFAENIHIVEACLNPAIAPYRFANSSADLILMDANWFGSEFTSAQIMRSFFEIDKDLKIVTMTSEYEPLEVEAAKKNGAKGYLYKSDIDEIVRCIKIVYNGDVCFSSIKSQI